MVLSIGNLNKEEIANLARCNLSTQIVAIQLKAEGGPKFVLLSRREVSCWQLFLKCFNLGKFADMEINLKYVAEHLNQFDWSECCDMDPHSETYNAYLKVCTLANKALFHKRATTLYLNVSKTSIEKKVNFSQYQGSRFIGRHNALQTIKWNPCIQVKHIKVLLEKTFPYASMGVEDEYHNPLCNSTHLSLEALKEANIYVEQHLFHPQNGTRITYPLHNHHRTCTTRHIHQKACSNAQVEKPIEVPKDQ